MGAYLLEGDGARLPRSNHVGRSRDWLKKALEKNGITDIDRDALMAALALFSVLGWDTKIAHLWTNFNLASILSWQWQDGCPSPFSPWLCFDMTTATSHISAQNWTWTPDNPASSFYCPQHMCTAPESSVPESQETALGTNQGGMETR
ncbi:hypothetical protein B0H10DRAFT_1947864 [Mycena sp. CBHHK59/15]|nr:hypothetical protein B0H10DRAFT_1947864 [Mycena sp. CBHHK59/15]